MPGRSVTRESAGWKCRPRPTARSGTSSGARRSGQARGDLRDRVAAVEQLRERVPLASDEAPPRALWHRSRELATGKAHPRRLDRQVDLDFLGWIRLDPLAELFAIGGCEHDARDAERRRVAEEDLPEAFGDDRSDAEVVERLWRVLARAAAAEVP